MSRTVKCGLIQAKNAAPTDAPIQEIIRLNVEKHVGMIEDAARQGVQMHLRRWQGNADLVSVRDREALSRLPEAERAAWQKLWADVADLARRAEGGSR